MNYHLIKDAILRVGEVKGIEGRKVYIEVDKNKNASELLFDGEILKNISERLANSASLDQQVICQNMH